MAGDHHGRPLRQATTREIDEIAFFKVVLDGDDIKRLISDGVPLAVEPQTKLATSWADLKG